MLINKNVNSMLYIGLIRRVIKLTDMSIIAITIYIGIKLSKDLKKNLKRSSTKKIKGGVERKLFKDGDQQNRF